MKRTRAALAVVLASHFVGATAHAWGNEGHRISGYIANALLTESVRSQLHELIGTDDLATVATLLDEERDLLEQRIPGSSRWHYENRQVCTRRATSKPECPKGQCITRQIERFASIGGNPSHSREQRADAVRGLAHLVGDLHQPLHLSDNNDRGGNELQVLLPDEKKARNLHEVWDTRIVRMNLRRRNEHRYALSLLARFSDRQANWSQGDTQSWAAETFAIANQHAYKALPSFVCGTQPGVIELSPAYVDQARALAEEQLAKAGIRLAYLLNQTLVR